MKLNYSHKIFLLSLVVFIGILILDIIFTYLLLDEIININNKVKQLDISFLERKKELTLKDSIKGSELDRKILKTYFVGAGNAETVAFTKYLENLALENGVLERKTLDYEPVGELSSSEIVSTIRFRFSVSGSWTNVFTFLQAIENLPKVAYLNSVFLGVKSDVWSAELDFSVVKLKI